MATSAPTTSMDIRVSRASMIAIIGQVPLREGRERGATRRIARRGGDGADGRHAHGAGACALAARG